MRHIFTSHGIFMSYNHSIVIDKSKDFLFDESVETIDEEMINSTIIQSIVAERNINFGGRVGIIFVDREQLEKHFQETGETKMIIYIPRNPEPYPFSTISKWGFFDRNAAKIIASHVKQGWLKYQIALDDGSENRKSLICYFHPNKEMVYEMVGNTVLLMNE